MVVDPSLNKAMLQDVLSKRFLRLLPKEKWYSTFRKLSD